MNGSASNLPSIFEQLLTTFGERIRQFREEQKLPQRKVAALLTLILHFLQSMNATKDNHQKN